MLIFEPKPYPSLTPTIGETLVDYFSGNIIGKIVFIYTDDSILVEDEYTTDKWTYANSGTASKIKEFKSTNMYYSYISWFKVTPTSKNWKTYRIKPLC